MIARKFLLLGSVLAALPPAPLQAQEVAPNDMLLATCGRSVRSNTGATPSRCSRWPGSGSTRRWPTRLDGGAAEQKGEYQNLPPAWCSMSTRPC